MASDIIADGTNNILTPESVTIVCGIVLAYLARATFLWASRRKNEVEIQTVRVPNGLDVFSHQKGETEYLYNEVWQEREYVQHGVSLEPGAVIFDVGANIGMFSLFAASECQGDLTVHAFEPIPKIHNICKKNLDRHIVEKGGTAHTHCKGLSDSPGSATFNFHSNFSLHSTGKRDFEARRKQRLESDIPAMLEDLLEKDKVPTWLSSVPHFLLHAIGRCAVHFLTRYEHINVELTTVSQVINDYKIERIDLLKIDVEGFEEDVLNGIKRRDWDKILQVVLEVEDFATRKRVSRLLKDHGFVVESEASEQKSNPRVSSEVSQVWAWKTKR